MAHQTTDLVSGAPLLIVDEATTTTIPHTETPIEILHMTATQLMITHTGLQGMKGTDMIDGIPTLVLDHRYVQGYSPSPRDHTTRGRSPERCEDRRPSHRCPSPGHVHFHSPSHNNKVNYKKLTMRANCQLLT